MIISILTLFPQMFAGTFEHSIVKNAIDKEQVSIRFINIRDFGIGRHKIVDDTPYGGGTGMIMKVDVLHKAILAAKDKSAKKEKVILLTPDGQTFTQKKAIDLAKLDHLILVCGRYEGFDNRIEQYVDEKISIGDYVLTGGEIPSMVITDAVVRLIPGVLKEGVTDSESFSHQNLEYPQFTRPQTYQNESIPKILLSGDHKLVDAWRKKESIKKTRLTRPDLLKGLR